MGRRGFRFLGNLNSVNQTSPSGQLKRAREGADEVASTSSNRLHSLELQDVKSGAVVGEVHHALRIDKAVCGLDDLRPVGTRGEHALWIGRHEKPSFARLARILDVKDPDAGIAAKMKRELWKAPGRFS